MPPPKKTEVAGARSPAIDGAPQLEDAGVGVALHQVVAVGVGGEGAVVAALPAERDVDVDAEGAQRPAVERTERMRRSRWTSMASVASSATSSAPAGGGPASTDGQVAAEDAAQQGQRGGAHGAAAAMGPAQRAAGDEVEGHQLHGAVGLAAAGALVEHGPGALEDERLEEEGRGEQHGVGPVVGQGARGRRRAWR